MSGGEKPLPMAVSEATVQIGSVALTVIQLDNGERVIEAESMHAFMAALENGSLILSDDDSMKLAKVLR